MAVIDIGTLVSGSAVVGYPNITHINKSNPADGTGKITQVKIYAYANLSNCEVGIFYRPDPVGFPNKFSTRDMEIIGTVVSGSEQTFGVDLEVVEGDYIGIVFTAGYVCAVQPGYNNRWYLNGDYIPCTNQTFTASTTNDTVSVYGTGVTSLTVTTQVCTNITNNSATGNGNIIDIGGENATIRGFCYMEGISGDPTIENSEVHDTGDFGIGAFTKAITGLSPATGYRVRAYATNPTGTSYGATVQLTTNWVKPTGYVDPDSKWTDEANAYDDDIDTYAENDVPKTSWSSFLELTHTAIVCSKIRFWAFSGIYIETIDIDAYYNDTWNHVYEGSYLNQSEIQKELSSPQTITAFRFRFYNSRLNISSIAKLYEVGFYEIFAPMVSTQAVSDITHNSSTGNGTVVSVNDGNCTKRGVCWSVSPNPTITDNKSEETGNFEVGTFTRPMTGLLPGQLYYVRAYAYNEAGYGYGTQVSFTTDKTTPTITTQDATEEGQNQVKGQGNITCAGGENCIERGFKYGFTKTATWSKSEEGSFEAGAFNLIIDELQANTEYWYQAFAVNTIGTGYGEWIKFQTSASGTIPIGTKINIGSDYSGYTYKLNSAFTDDGETYESYFVLSTDLAGGQGLHINKRLLDLFSYFDNKNTGTCKIYIKRDNEVEWQYAGEISLTGDEDIIVKHLPSENEDSSGDVDFLAKSFLIKFVFTNDFEFIGLITESIPIGVR